MNTVPSSSLNWRAALGLIFLGAAALALATPLDGLNLHPLIPAWQAQAKAALVVLAPYLVVAVLGAGVGLSELASTFSDYPREAIATRWGQLLIWLNAVAAVLAFLIAQVYAPATINPLVLIIGVGVGFPALIRTKFTLAKQFGGEGSGDLNLNVGWLYEQFQALCKKQIDLELMRSRLESVERLLAQYSTPQLYVIARYTVQARATLTAQEEAARLDELKQIIADTEGGPQATRMGLALLILELGGKSYVDRLVAERPGAPAAPAATALATLLPGATPDNSTEAVAKRLTDLPFAELVALAKEVLKSPEDEAYVQQAAAASADLSEVKRKAPIAYYIISKAGIEAAEQALNASVMKRK